LIVITAGFVNVAAAPLDARTDIATSDPITPILLRSDKSNTTVSRPKIAGTKRIANVERPKTAVLMRAR